MMRLYEEAELSSPLPKLMRVNGSLGLYDFTGKNRYNLLTPGTKTLVANMYGKISNITLISPISLILTMMS